MIASLSFLTDGDFFSGRAVAGVVESFADVGCSTMFDGDFAVVGGNTAVGLSDAAMGGQGLAIAVVQTGLAGDEVALLVGASGVDTLGDTRADAVMTGCNATNDDAAGADLSADLGTDTIAIRAAVPATGFSCDLGMLLQRVASVSLLAPAHADRH